jgi:hypothetical protein
MPMSTTIRKLADDLHALGLRAASARLRAVESADEAKALCALLSATLEDVAFDEFTAGLVVELLRGDVR